MQDARPINLKLTSIHFPVPAIISILHRISGVVLFFGIPYMLWLLERSLTSAEVFAHLVNPWFKSFVWIIVAALIYHFIAGIRHLCMDFGWCEGLGCAKVSAYIVLILSAALSILFGVMLWA